MDWEQRKKKSPRKKQSEGDKHRKRKVTDGKNPRAVEMYVVMTGTVGRQQGGGNIGMVHQKKPEKGTFRMKEQRAPGRSPFLGDTLLLTLRKKKRPAERGEEEAEEVPNDVLQDVDGGKNNGHAGGVRRGEKMVAISQSRRCTFEDVPSTIEKRKKTARILKRDS